MRFGPLDSPPHRRNHPPETIITKDYKRKNLHKVGLTGSLCYNSKQELNKECGCEIK